MGRRSNLLPDQVERILEMREAGVTVEAIAAAIPCSVGSISYHCLKAGVLPPKFLRPQIQPDVIRFRRGRPVRPFTPEEDAQLLALAKAGLNHSEIGKRIGRRPNSVGGRLMTLARLEAVAEEHAVHA